MSETSEIILDDESSVSSGDDDITLSDLMQTFFVGDNSLNVVDTLQSIKASIDTQNKILAKISSSVDKYLAKT